MDVDKAVKQNPAYRPRDVPTFEKYCSHTNIE